MTPEPATYPGFRFPAEVIRHSTWLYHLFGLSLRDTELILAERGVVVRREHPALVRQVRRGLRGQAAPAAAEAR
jgi:transposase-like protein